MGWMGYGIYSGDDTQTCHYKFLAKAKIANEDEADSMMGRKTIIPKEKHHLLTDNISIVLKSMPKFSNSMYEWDLIEWQMLLSLFLDNNICPPKEVYENGIEATEMLMDEHARDFNNPSARRKVLKNFIEKAKKVYFTNLYNKPYQKATLKLNLDVEINFTTLKKEKETEKAISDIKNWLLHQLSRQVAYYEKYPEGAVEYLTKKHTVNIVEEKIS